MNRARISLRISLVLAGWETFAGFHNATRDYSIILTTTLLNVLSSARLQQRTRSPWKPISWYLQEQRLVEHIEADLNRFAARPPQNRLAFDLYFFIQCKKHPSYGSTLSCCCTGLMRDCEHSRPRGGGWPPTRLNAVRFIPTLL